MAGRWKAGPSPRTSGVPDYSPNDADRAWVERELGDVAHDRVIGASCHDNPIVWVESLGRDQ